MTKPIVVACYDDAEGYTVYDTSEVNVLYLDGYMESESVWDLTANDVVEYIDKITLTMNNLWEQMIPSQRTIVMSHLDNVRNLRDDIFFGIPEGEEDIPVEEMT